MTKEQLEKLRGLFVEWQTEVPDSDKRITAYQRLAYALVKNAPDLLAEVDRLTAVAEAANGIHVKSDRDGKAVIIGMLALSDALAALEQKP